MFSGFKSVCMRRNSCITATHYREGKYTNIPKLLDIPIRTKI
jgi:hypothetical protein